MKKFVTAVLVVFVVSLFAVPAQAALQYHTGADLLCHDCHTVHASEANALRGTTAGGSDLMLINTSTNTLCLTCHDNVAEDQDTAGAAPDVMTGYTGALGFVRKAGAFQSDVGVASDNAHDLGVASAIAPGDLDNPDPANKYTANATTGLTCASCHDPHGTTLYSNLLADPNPNSSIATFTGVLGTDILLGSNNATNDNIPSTKYSLGNVTYKNGKISDFCADCHFDFHHQQGSENVAGDAGGANDAWERHPTGRSIADTGTSVISVTSMTLADGHGKADLAYWSNAARLSRVPVADPDGTRGNNYPICMSCHQAHGTAHDSATLWDNDATADLADGTSIKQTCKQCHNK